MESKKSVQLALDRLQCKEDSHYTVYAHSADGKPLRKDIELIVEDRSTGEDPPQFLRSLNDLSVKVGTRARLLVEIRSFTTLKVYYLDLIDIIMFIYKKRTFYFLLVFLT